MPCLVSLFFKTVCAKHPCEALRLPVPEKIFLARATSLLTGGSAAHGWGVRLKSIPGGDCWHPLNGYGFTSIFLVLLPELKDIPQELQRGILLEGAFVLQEKKYLGYI